MSDFYERVYRKLHPKTFPFSPYERQPELTDLWPVDQQKFKDTVDAIAVEQERRLQRGWKPLAE